MWPREHFKFIFGRCQNGVGIDVFNHDTLEVRTATHVLCVRYFRVQNTRCGCFQTSTCWQRCWENFLSLNGMSVHAGSLLNVLTQFLRLHRLTSVTHMLTTSLTNLVIFGGWVSHRCKDLGPPGCLSCRSLDTSASELPVLW